MSDAEKKPTERQSAPAKKTTEKTKEKTNFFIHFSPRSAEENIRESRHLKKILSDVDASEVNEYLSTYLAAKKLSGDQKTGLFSLASDPRYQEILADKTRLEHELSRSLNEISTEKKISKEKQLELATKLEEFQAKERLGAILSRVREDAQQLLLQSKEFQNNFLETRQCQSFVMAVDIRRSTELMLKARSPEDFSRFITRLCEDLKEIIIDSYGVFDKFTGDGVLAFFPDFYSGDDAAYRVVDVADKCHAAFDRHYHAFRKSFNSVLTDVGLGIGVDFGLVHLVNIAGGLTVVGVPVVYACRLSGAPPGNTLLNQPAYEKVMEKSGQFCFIDETELEIKHEGKMLAYDVRLNARSHIPNEPSWFSAANGHREEN